MAAALALARRGLGRTSPNPSVGCVLVAGGRVVGRAVTRPGGRPHAETEALKQAGEAARGATAYVTLEPCAHQGATPPCAEALAEAGLSRVVVALRDPDPRTAGKGIARLRAAGIEVTEGVCASEAAEVNAGFLSRVVRGRPLVTLKVAATLDGRIAAASGASKWITGEAARRRGHLLRAEHDAIMVGSGTVLADDPALTCRLPGLEAASPLRIIVDSGLRLPLSSLLVRSATVTPLWVACGVGADAESAAALRVAGVDIIEMARDAAGRVSLRLLLQELGERGLTRILVEGGPTLATSLLAEQLVDRLAWFAAPSLMGGDGLAALGALGVASPAEAVRLHRGRLVPAGEDTMFCLDVEPAHGST